MLNERNKRISLHSGCFNLLLLQLFLTSLKLSAVAEEYLVDPNTHFVSFFVLFSVCLCSALV